MSGLTAHCRTHKGGRVFLWQMSHVEIRCVVFSTCSDLLGSLPPPPRLPDDDVWQVLILSRNTFLLQNYQSDPQVLVTTIECISRVTIRLLGETWAGRLDALLGDMDLHYFQVNPTKLNLLSKLQPSGQQSIASSGGWEGVRSPSCLGVASGSCRVCG